jgi:hypothetical protein
LLLPVSKQIMGDFICDMRYKEVVIRYPISNVQEAFNILTYLAISLGRRLGNKVFEDDDILF